MTTRKRFGPVIGLVLVTTLAIAGFVPILAAAPNVRLWDTRKALPETGDAIESAEWKTVPRNLFTLEADPLKASSDPGYYGREYAFKGDAVVENRRLTAVFSSAAGRVRIYSKATPNSDLSAETPPLASQFGRKVAEISPRTGTAGPFRIAHYSVVRNAADEVILEVAFHGSGSGSKDSTVTFGFGKSEILEVKPKPPLKLLRVASPIEYAVVPGFVADDLLLNANSSPDGEPLHVPADHALLALLQGGNDAWVMTWPGVNQSVRLIKGAGQEGKRSLEAVDIESDGQSVYLAPLAATGIWHREELKPTYLEKDMPVKWTRPFPAKWTTQLLEEGVKTRYTFRPARGEVWRGVPGSYTYPAWFDGDIAMLHFGKKVPPKGEAILYFLEGQDTPPGINTPADILRETLGRATVESLLDVAGRRLRTYHRRGGDGVHRACTCGCTEFIQAIFEEGREGSKTALIEGALSDMNYFVEQHVERIEEYQRFASEMLRFLESKAGSTPALKGYVDELAQTAQRIPQEYEVQKENMKSASFAADLTRQTLALAGRRSTNNLAAYMELLKAWRGMGGAQDYVLASCHMNVRRLFQEAGLGCLSDPAAVAVAREVRARCRKILRNPDGYEVWADY